VFVTSTTSGRRTGTRREQIDTRNPPVQNQPKPHPVAGPVAFGAEKNLDRNQILATGLTARAVSAEAAAGRVSVSGPQQAWREGGDWKVPSTRRQECLRHMAQAVVPAGSGGFPTASLCCKKLRRTAAAWPPTRSLTKAGTPDTSCATSPIPLAAVQCPRSARSSEGGMRASSVSAVARDHPVLAGAARASTVSNLPSRGEHLR
jgi:hypothetical protein